jgi:4-hydroxybenzoate polyprenyltransferase
MSRSGYRALAVNGTEYARRVLRGEEPLIGIPFWSFAREMMIAMRPHFFALPSLAALAGAANPNYRSDSDLLDGGSNLAKNLLAALVCGLGWGVGQIINDLMDRESDRVNAPDRAISRGHLPAGPALLFAVTLGVLLSAAIVLKLGHAWFFVPPAALLMIFYNAAKKWPVLGNVAHGALVAVAAAIGASSVIEPISPFEAPHDPSVMFFLEMRDFYPVFIVVGSIAAWYLQSNYEKDRPGDRAAGYMTLAVVMPVRASAAIRAAGMVAIAIAARAFRLLPDEVSMVTMAAGVVVGLISTIGPMIANTDAAALHAYRYALVASILCLLALAAPLLGRWATSVVLVLALLLVRAAFRRSENP